MIETVDYDIVSQVYDASRVANVETIKKLVKLLGIDKASIILDMGCGTGNYSDAVNQTAKKIIGIDISEGMIKKAHTKFPRLTFICGDITKLPFNTDTFDGAFAIQVLHHIENKLAFFKEAYRVLRREACIAIHQCSHQQIRAFWFYRYFPKGLEADLARIPDFPEVTSLLEAAGFSNIGMEICYQDEVVAHETPESYLDKAYRDSISTFAILTPEDIESGCKKLRAEIASGTVNDFIRQSKELIAKETGGSSIIYGQKAG
jgi:SAM-dependent methyltransferase